MYYRANGKLLITGEYVILDGAKSLSIPTKFGQTMIVSLLNSFSKKIFWKAFDYQYQLWFSCIIDLEKIIVLRSSNNNVSFRLLQLFKGILKLNPSFYKNLIFDYQINTYLEFPNTWGLGSSSTLITNLANFTKVNAYKLLEKSSFLGSGYDIACAKNNSSILFTKTKNKYLIEPVNFTPSFSDKIYFIHLNKKQNSYKEILNYQKIPKNKILIENISKISKNIINTTSIKEFEEWINEHENLLSKHLKKEKIQNVYFNDYQEGIIKSLGAWGGDFIMVTSTRNPKRYFQKKGFNSIFTFKEMIFN